MANNIMPVLYESASAEFSTDGLGTLCDAISCVVTEERNGVFELTMDYPMEGLHYAELRTDRLIKASPNETDLPQAFRIYCITKPMNGIVTVNAEHISYMLNSIPVAGFSASGVAAGALDTLLRSAVVSTRFTSTSDITTGASTEIKEPCSVRSCLGGREGSILDRWGGEYRFDNFSIALLAQRGQKTDVVIEYGKNLTDITQEERIDSMYTAVMPYARKTVEEVDYFYYITEKYIAAKSASAFAFPRILTVDFSEQFAEDETPTEERLKELAQLYIDGNGIGIPKVSIEVCFIPLWQSEEYQAVAALERVRLCDTLTVKFPRLGVDATAKVIKTVYDVLKGRYISIELGDARSNFTDSVKNLEQTIRDVNKRFEDVPSMVGGEIERATGLITGANGGHVMIRPDANGKPQEILILDTDSIATAKKVWRWNINGMGYSSNGINGPYETAITMDGHILGKFISALTIVGSQIIAGRIQSINGNVYFDLEANDGQGEIAASTLVAPSNDYDTQAYIGTVLDAGRSLEAFMLETKAGKGGKVTLSVNRSGGITSHKFPYANDTRFDSDGSLYLKSNTKSSDPEWIENALSMRTDDQGRCSVGMSLGGGAGAPYGDIGADWANAWISHENEIQLIVQACGVIITDTDVQVQGDLNAEDIYSYGQLVTSDPEAKQDISKYQQSPLEGIKKASVYRYRLKEGAGVQRTKTRRASQEVRQPLRVGLMYDEVPEEIRRELPNGKKCVDLYGVCALLWGAVRELSEQIEEIKVRAEK